MEDKELDRTEGYRPYDIEDPEVRKSLRGRWFRDVREDDTPEMAVSSFGCNEDGYEWCVNEIYTARTFLRDCVWMDDGSPCGVKEDKGKIEVFFLYHVFRKEGLNEWEDVYATVDLQEAYEYAARNRCSGRQYKVMRGKSTIATEGTRIMEAVRTDLWSFRSSNVGGHEIWLSYVVDGRRRHDSLRNAVIDATEYDEPDREFLK